MSSDLPTSGELHATGRATVRLAAASALALAVAAGLFLMIRVHGETLTPAPAAPVVAPEPPSAGKGEHPLARVLLALMTIVVAGRALGVVLGYLGQPRVIGEVLAGILLGPSLLGRISPEAMNLIFPHAVDRYLGMIAQLGIIFYMFLVGVRLNTAQLRTQAAAAIAVSQLSILLPFTLGAALALVLYSDWAPAGVGFTHFAVFLGVALAITAFPVLARILTDLRIEKTPLGTLALGCAAVNDLIGWCLLALVIGFARGHFDHALTFGLWTAALIGVMLLVARPLARRWLGASDPADVPPGAFALLLIAVLSAALAAEWIGIHAVFGAFLLGAMIPHDSAAGRQFANKSEDTVSVLLLPAFFAYTGLRTEIGLISGWTDWLICLAIIAIATFGKVGGAWLGARLAGLDHRTSAAVGLLMNTRGLMELIVLNVGLEYGIITPKLFAMMVLMALATTMSAGPLIQWLLRIPGEKSPRLTPDHDSSS